MSTLFRTVKVSFWADKKVTQMNQVEKLTFLYLFTNSHSSISCCYELPLGVAAIESGYSCVEDFVVVLERLRDVWKVIDFDEDNEEILVCNRGKYAWDADCKSCKQMLTEAKEIKTDRMRKYIQYLAKNKFDENNWDNTYCNYYDGLWRTGEVPDTVSIQYHTETENKKENKKKEEKEITDVSEIPENSRKIKYFELYISSLDNYSQAVKNKLIEYYNAVRGIKFFTFKQVKSQIAILDTHKYSEDDIIDAIDTSIMRSYSGFYPHTKGCNPTYNNYRNNKVQVNNNFARNIQDLGNYKEF